MFGVCLQDLPGCPIQFRVSGMTADAFRKLALALPGAIESAHMDHPDFRAGNGGKIFASLGYPDEDWGMVKLTPEQQETMSKESPAAFKPCNGAWGRNGATNVCLAEVDAQTLKSALALAFHNLAQPPTSKQRRKPKARKPNSRTPSLINRSRSL